MLQPSPDSSPDPSRSWLTGAQPPSSSAAAPSTTPSPSTPPASPSQQPPPPTQPAQPGQQPPAGPSSVADVINSIKPSDLLKVHQTPCAQQGFVTGIGAGALMGLGRWVIGLPAPKAAHWAVGTGVLGAMAQYEYCQYKRRLEREKMLRMVEVYTAKQAKEKQEAEEKRRREREEKQREEMERKERAGSRGWWRIW